MSVAVASVLSLPVAAVTLAGGSVLLFMILLRATRLARAPWYARGLMMELMCPTLVGLGAFGIALLVRLGYQLVLGVVPTLGQALAAITVALAIAALVVRLARAMVPPATLAPVVPMPTPTSGPSDPRPELPRAA